VLLVPTLAGRLAPLESALRGVMAARPRPLPSGYLGVFLLLGALLPLLLRLLGRARPAVRQLLDPYLVLLAGQVVSEAILVLAGGVALGVVVGSVFTLLRLGQLLGLAVLLGPRLGGRLRVLLVGLSLLWTLNLLQLVTNRWWPLLG
jgi:hypothetical protein